VYLPAGDWFDFWTHAKISGGRFIEAANGIAQIPLFVKGGTLLPLAESVEFVKPDTCFNLTVNIVGKNPMDFTLYEDDGATTAYANGEQNQIQLRADGENHPVQRNGNYHGPARYKITGWKQF
jgi:alpha-D-xyloside xylohydrolase